MPQEIPVYKSDNPQTNISIYEFYQKLAYKWRNWLSETNKYEEIIPVIKDKNGDDVPNLLLENQSIGLNLPIYSYFDDTKKLTYHSAPIYIAEGLLMQQVLFTIPYELEQIDFITWEGFVKPTFGSYRNYPEEYGYINEHGGYDHWHTKGYYKYVRYDTSKYNQFLGTDELKFGDLTPPYNEYTLEIIQDIKDRLYRDYLNLYYAATYNEWYKLGSNLTYLIFRRLRTGDYIYFNLELAEDPPYSDLEVMDKERKRNSPQESYRYLGKFLLYRYYTYSFHTERVDEEGVPFNTYDIIYDGKVLTEKYYHVWLWASAPNTAWTGDPSLDLGIDSYSYGKLDEEGNYDPEGRYQEYPSSKENRFFRPIHSGRINFLVDIDKVASE